ncbi:uncharacterized protein UV8b_07253 [Ustilaginoidea virens]|uniref:Uncharacterized protein n=1 Tax=Ustilaginoidea virens TaxID=1159556 RepID=A0A063BS03_USTVR|nr:uncharacterized protein UV8b_07253 [Ustilaginoidea virens]QUC23012.1 hypothetical protein UV8b_07253 [Ustilaginoidea virens]GAO19088.1 hypothetical protein UVI_02042120 [Ustilaginoidea virens]
MQKLAKRAAQAQRQATRRARQHVENEKIDHRIQNRDALKGALSEIRRNLKDARQARMEDWEMGPLAPKRDLGFNNYGVLKEAARFDWTNSGLHQAKPQLVEQRCAWAGGVRQLNLVPQDRVLIMDGPDKGKIDRIKDVQAENGTVTLQNCHRALSEGMFGGGPRSQSMPIAISSIRLVYPITNPETGVTKDAVINQLKAVPPNMQSPNMSLDRWHYGKKWDRLVPALNMVIPWPEVQVPEYEAAKADTVRQQVEERTFYYNLLSPPMPDQVLDELRNKYSRFRTRHEPWYIKQKEMEEAAKKGRIESVKSMQTPLDEFHQRQRELRDAKGEPELSDDMLEKIGEHMAKKKALVLDQIGASEDSRQPAA